MPDPYKVGTVTVSSGGTVVTGTGTFWAGKVRKNDLFTDPAQGLFARVLADATENDELLINPWPGTEITDGQYEIMDTADGVDTAARLRALLAAMGVVQANGRGLFFFFDDSIAETMPSSGQLRLNALSAGEASEAFVSLYDAEGASVSAELSSWGYGTSPIKGRLYLRSIARPSVLHSYFVTASAASSFATLDFEHIGGTGSFEPGEPLMAVFSTKGDQGEAFHTDADAADMAGLVAFADEDDGFRVFVTDLGAGHDHRSGVVEKAGGDWPVVSYYTGATGPISTVPGPPGPMGVNPLNAPYDPERVYALNDLMLDNGSTWRAIQDGFVGFAPPALPTTSNDYWMLFARAGTDGAGTVAGIGQGDGISVDATDPTNPIVSLDAAFSDLKDVDFTTNPPEDGDTAVWNAALGKFVPGAGGGGGSGLQIIREYKSSATWSPIDPDNLKGILVEVLGGGGGGGGSGDNNSVGGGGGGGGYAEKFIPAEDLGETETVEVGAAGSGGAAGANNGTAGGTSSFGAELSATGGAGGPHGSGDSTPAAGGVGVGGDINIAGGPGSARRTGGAIASTSGGNAPKGFGYGGQPLPATTNINGANASGFGAGGSGGLRTSINVTGGNGTPALVIVREFY